MRDWFPPRPFLDALAVRGFVLWCVARAVIGAGSSAAAGASLSSATSLVLVGSTVTAVVLATNWIEMWRRGELLFLANLGFASRHVAVFLVLLCGLMELGWALIGG